MNGRSSFDLRQRRKDFSSSLYMQTATGAHPASCIMATEDPFPGHKARPGRDADHSPHLLPRSKMSRSYTSSSLSAFVACSGTALAYLYIDIILLNLAKFSRCRQNVLIFHLPITCSSYVVVIKTFGSTKVTRRCDILGFCTVTHPLNHSFKRRILFFWRLEINMATG
jgi:hypothetical protein